MSILITGASGFLGGRLAQRLVERGEKVRVLARKTSKLDHLEGIAVDVAEGSLEDAASLKKAARDVATIYHCAGLSADWGAWAEFEAVNVTGVRNLLAAAREAGTVRRFVHVSTTDVYGYPERACDESYGIRDIGLPYNRSKGLGEKAVWEFHGNTGLPVTVIRPVNMYGPRSKDFVVEVANLLVQGQMMFINHGKAVAGLLFVDNAVDGMIAAAATDRTIGRAYNLRDDGNQTWNDYVSALARGLGTKPPWIDVPDRIAYVLARGMEGAWGGLRIKGRPLVTRHSVMLLSRDQGYPTAAAQRDFDFRSTVGFDDALARTVAWLDSPAGRKAVPRKS